MSTRVIICGSQGWVRRTQYHLWYKKDHKKVVESVRNGGLEAQPEAIGYFNILLQIEVLSVTNCTYDGQGLQAPIESV